MSYARFGPDSQVYIYAHTAGGYECCACYLVPWPGPSPHFETAAQVRKHLDEHIAAGHKVPQDCIEAIDRELALERRREPNE